jgi:hypothetical protein
LEERRRKKEEGRKKKEEGRRKKEEGRRKKEEKQANKLLGNFDMAFTDIRLQVYEVCPRNPETRFLKETGFLCTGFLCTSHT